MKKYTKTIAPRLASGDKRNHYTGGLPPRVRSALFLIARDEKKSVSWVLEQVIIDYFNMSVPKYIERKEK